MNIIFILINDCSFDGISPVNVDITGQIMLWDAGTEVNEYPGAGLHQGPGGTEESENVTVVDDGFSWLEISQLIKVTITAL